MTQAILDREPNSIIAGDFIRWRRTIPGFPAGTWVLSYALLNSTTRIIIEAGSDGTDHLVAVNGTTTSNYAAGTYQWQAYVTYENENRVTVGTGQMIIQPNFGALTNMDTRSHVKKTLDALEAMIAGKATSDQQEYTIANRSLKRMSISDLLMWRDKYKAEYNSQLAAENIAKGLGGKNRILVRI